MAYPTPTAYCDCDLTTGANDGTSWANAYQSLQTAFDNETAGAIVACQGTDTLAASIDIDTNAGGAGSAIVFDGRYSGGAFSASARTTIDCDSSVQIALNFGTGIRGIMMIGFTITNVASGNAAIYSNSNGDLVFKYFTVTAGSYVANLTFDRVVFDRCTLIGGNGAAAAMIYNVSSIARFTKCVFKDNANAGGVDCGTSNSVVVEDCIFHNLGGIGLECENLFVIRNNTFDGCSSDGVRITGNNVSWGIIEKNRFTHNGGYGANLSTATILVEGDYNAFYNNTSGEKNLTSDWYGGDNDVSMSGDGYTNRTGDDFTLTDSAEARRIASDIGDADFTSYTSAGAVTPTDSGGGGGGRLIGTGALIG